MKNFRRSKKALSPVVASIILIAVTVAVSIAVAAWMGALSIGFMDTEQLSITNIAFSGTDTITLTVSNTGTNAVTLNQATVNDLNAPITNGVDGSLTVPANTPGNAVVLQAAWESGASYQVVLMSSKGNYFPYNAVAP